MIQIQRAALRHDCGLSTLSPATVRIRTAHGSNGMTPEALRPKARSEATQSAHTGSRSRTMAGSPPRPSDAGGDCLTGRAGGRSKINIKTSE